MGSTKRTIQALHMVNYGYIWLRRKVTDELVRSLGRFGTFTWSF